MWGPDSTRDGLHGDDGRFDDHEIDVDGVSHGLTRFRKIVDACDQFESTWRSGRRPAIEAWIRSLEPDDRAVFLKELLELEIELRLLAGEVPTIAEYQARFPDDVKLVERVFEGLCRPLPPPATTEFAIKPQPQPPLPETTSLGWIGRYELLSRLGGGGMGVIYRAMHHDAKRIVALKLIRPDILGGALVDQDLEAIERFRNEATAAARLKHANIVTVYDVGEFDGRPYYAMECIEGQSLAERLAQGPIDDNTVAVILEQIARAVHQAHTLSLLHRDIKPGNILIDRDGKPLITDFGLVKLLDNAPHLSMTSGPIGTSYYMSPEQARCDPKLGRAADVYSIGATLYEMITGRPPFRAATVIETLRQVVNEEPAPPRSLNPAISKDLETICLKCLQKEPARRYESAEALADDFRHYLRGEPIEARPVGALTRFALWAKRNPKIAALSLAVYVLLAMIAVGSTALVVLQNETLRIVNQSWVREHLRRGIAMADGPRISDALPLLAEAIRLEDEAGVRSDASLARLASILRQSPKPIRIWAREGPVQEGILSRSGRYVATVSGNEVEIVDAGSDQPVKHGRIRHANRIGKVAFSPDERLIAIADSAGDVQIRSFIETERGRIIKVADTEIRALVFRPDGQAIATASGNTTRVWSAATGDPISPWLKHDDQINALAFSPDGSTLAVAAGGPNRLRFGEAMLWQLAGKNATSAIQPVRLEHLDDVGAIAFSGDGKTLATGSYDQSARLWDVARGALIRRWDLHADASRVAISPDGSTIAAATGDLLYLIDVDSDQVSAPLKHPANLLQVAFSNDGRKVAVVADDWTARVWDVSQKELLLPALVHSARINSIGFSGDGRYLLTAAADRTAKLWDLACGQGPRLSVVLQSGTEEELNQAWTSRDGRRLLVIGDDGSARVFDTATGKTVAPPVRFGRRGIDGAFHPGGVLFGTLDEANRVNVWNVETGSVLYAVPAEEGKAVALAFSDDGTRFVTASNLNGDADAPPAGLVTLRSAFDGSVVLGPIRQDARIEGMAIDPRLSKIATYDVNGTVRIFNGRDGKAVGPPIRHEEGLNQIAFRPDGTLIATAGKDGRAMLWKVGNSAQHGHAMIHDQAINQVAFSADGSRIATAGQDRFARIWSTVTTEPAGEPMLHELDVQTVGFSKDGRYLVSGSGSRIAGGPGESTVWEVSTGYRLTRPIALGAGVKIARCLEDGESFLTVSKQNTHAVTWQLPRADLSKDKLLRLAAIVSGSKAVGNESVVPLPAKTLADEHRKVRLENPEVFAPNQDDLLHWHHNEAASCERLQRWSEALPHLDVLVQFQPHARDVSARRAKVLGELGRLDEAEREFERATDDGSGDIGIWYLLQLLRVGQGKIAAYQGGCAILQKRYGPHSSTWERNNFAYICSLHPKALDDDAQLLKMITNRDETELELDAPAYQNTRAAVLFRVKQYNEACRTLERLQKTGKAESSSISALSSELLLTMTYAKLGRRAEAREHFSRIEPRLKQLLERATASPSLPLGSEPLKWNDRLHLEIFLKETAELLESEVPPATTPSSANTPDEMPSVL